MSESELPDVPESSRDLTPHAGGDCPTKAKLLMYLAAMPLNVVWGAVAHYLGIAITYLTVGVFLL